MLRRSKKGRRSTGIGAVAQKVKVCPPGAPLDLVATAVLESPHKVAPVVEDKILLGLVWEEDLPGPRSGLRLTAGDLMRPPEVLLPPNMSPLEAEEMLSERGLRAAPVIDDSGKFLGFVGRAELTAARMGILKPRRVGGMATPLGVYLTTGHVRAGAPDLGLFLAGMALATILVSSLLACFGIFYLLDKISGLPLFAAVLSPSYATLSGMGWVTKILPGAQIILFLLFLRLSPLAGYHGAEHQVVHTIEQGEPLDPEGVSKMPRAHKRCGTNLLTLFIVAFILVPLIKSWLAILVALVLWRFLGGPIQTVFTTKRPSRKQLASAIKAARELLDNHLLSVGRKTSLWGRIWNMGLVQVMAGFAVIMGIAWAFLGDILLLVP